MPRLGLGTWQLTGSACEKAVAEALRIGYRHIDTAEAYRNEKEIGRAIAGFKRDELFLTSKVSGDLSYEGVIHACERSLSLLDTDYLDLYLIHWPGQPLRQALLAMNDLVKRKKVKSIGVSNFNPRWLRDAITESNQPVSVNQIEMHPYNRQDLMREYAKREGVAITAYSPVIRGRAKEDETLAAIGDRIGKSASQVAIKWALQKGVSVIPKASSRRHLEENFAMDFTLSQHDMSEIDRIPTSMSIVSGPLA
jgi:2,5-diketo-D-gluconate reductase B